jgi:predicted ATPase
MIMDNSEDAKKIPEVYISQLRFNNDQTIDIKKNDIVVFVGPNNVGKSQALKDIWEIADEKPAGIVVKSLLFSKESAERLVEYLRTVFISRGEGNRTMFYGLDFYVSNELVPFSDSNHLRHCRNIFIRYLSTDNRLSICNPPEAITLESAPKHPIHHLVRHPSCRETFSEYYKKAFGVPAVPNSLFGGREPLCLGSIPQCSEIQGTDAHDFVEKYSIYLRKQPMLHNQGDGMRSFAGVLLYLSIDFYHTFLIDEPETFLHPPQANIMGQVIAELLRDDQQAFISTHSQHLIKGLLEKAPDRVKIIRITRDGDNNTFSILENNKINELLQDPLLKYSEVLDGLFYKNVVICESDADCRFYSIVNGFLKEQQGAFSESLFVHSSGKDRMEKIVRTLKALNIECRVIPDMDILSQKEVFQALIEACGGSWDTFKTDYTILVNGLEHVDNLTGAQLQDIIQKILSSYLDKEVPRAIIDDLKNELEFKGKWDKIKKMGIMGVPNGDPSAATNRIIHNLKEIGICIVPVGELEGFIKDAGGHGPKWLNNVLEHHPDLSDEVFNEAKQFVSSWNI